MALLKPVREKFVELTRVNVTVRWSAVRSFPAGLTVMLVAIAPAPRVIAPGNAA